MIDTASKNFDAYTSGFEPDADHVQKMTSEVEQIEKVIKNTKPSKEDVKALNQLKEKMGMDDKWDCYPNNI